jgi:hypothetical protein
LARLLPAIRLFQRRRAPAGALRVWPNSGLNVPAEIVLLPLPARVERIDSSLKAALADEHTTFGTSANLTGSVLDVNIEFGLLVRGGPTPRRIAHPCAD